MSKAYVTLPATGKQVSLRIYVRAIKTAIAHPTVEFKEGLTCWWPCTGADIRRQFRDGIHDRINTQIPYHARMGK